MKCFHWKYFHCNILWTAVVLYCSTSVIGKLKWFVTRDPLYIRYGYMCAGAYACESHLFPLLLFCRIYWHCFLRQGLLLKLLFPCWAVIPQNLSVYASPTWGLLTHGMTLGPQFCTANTLRLSCLLSHCMWHYIFVWELSHIIIHVSLLFHKTLLVQAYIAWLLLISSD